MKKLLAILAVLALAVPAMAGSVTLSGVDDDGIGAGLVGTISYSATSGLPRAFALDITVDGGAVITAAARGTCQPYRIYMGTITIVNGVVTDWGNPVAPASDPGALGGIGTAGVTVEMGSLYDMDNAGDGNKPAASGCLLKVTANKACNVTVALNTTRGGIVMEDATAATTNAPISFALQAAPPECFPSGHPKYNEWVSVGKPNCWCYPRQCHGDADGTKLGTSILGYWYVGTSDLAVLSSAWTIKEPTKGPGLTGTQICADFARDKQGTSVLGYWRVGTNDLAALVAYWTVKEPTKGPGTPTDCGGTLVP